MIYLQYHTDFTERTTTDTIIKTPVHTYEETVGQNRYWIKIIPQQAHKTAHSMMTLFI